MLREVQFLFVRTVRGNLRNPLAFFGRLAATALMVALVSVTYLGTRQRIQSQIVDRLWAVLWMQHLAAFLCIGAVPAFTQEFACFRKEVKNGLYRPLSHCLAHTLVSVPFWFALSLAALLPATLILDLNCQHFLQRWLLMTAYIGFSDAWAQLCGASFRSVALASMAFMVLVS